MTFPVKGLRLVDMKEAFSPSLKMTNHDNQVKWSLRHFYVFFFNCRCKFVKSLFKLRFKHQMYQMLRTTSRL